MTPFPIHRTILLALLAVAAPGASAALAAGCGPGPFAFSLPEEPLGERLESLARTTGCPVDVDASLPGGLAAPALEGDLPTDEAFFRSVAGSGLEAGPVQGRWRISRDAQDGFSERVSALEGDLRTAEAAGRITGSEAERLRAELSSIRRDVPGLVREKGFLSAAEAGSFERSLEEIAGAFAR